jgi:fructose-1-phosphate kinase PfkB-like protein
VLHARAKVIVGRSAVGSGDATLAGFAYAFAEGLNAEQTLRRAAACGAANCLADSPGRIRLQDVRRIEKTVRVDVLPE